MIRRDRSNFLGQVIGQSRTIHVLCKIRRQRLFFSITNPLKIITFFCKHNNDLFKVYLERIAALMIVYKRRNYKLNTSIFIISIIYLGEIEAVK
jgi:hypothetical protein